MKDTPPEIEKLQFEMMMRLSPNQRIAMACQIFMAAREMIIASIPKNLSEREFKKQLYERTYGEPLPEDFLRSRKKNEEIYLFDWIVFVVRFRFQSANGGNHN